MEFTEYDSSKSRASVATRFNKTLTYVKLTYSSNKKFTSEIKEGTRYIGLGQIEKYREEIPTKSFSWIYFYNYKKNKWLNRGGITDKTKNAIDAVFKYAKDNNIDNFFYNFSNYEGEPEYFQYIPALVVFIISKIVEKNLNGNLYCCYGKGTNYKGYDDQIWDNDLGNDDEVFGTLEFYSKKAEDIPGFIDEFQRVFNESPYKDDFKIEMEYKKTNPRRPKTTKKVSDKEKLKLANEAYDQLIENLPEEVLGFFKRNNLNEPFKEDFIKNAVNDELNTMHFEGDLMMGDADGYENVGEVFYKAEFDYISEWLKAYQKKYPNEYDRKAIFFIERDMYSGCWLYKDICELFKTFSPRVLSHSGHISGVLSVCHVKNVEWENEFETDVDATLDDMIIKYPDKISEVLLPYATYWNLHGKSDDALVEIKEDM